MSWGRWSSCTEESDETKATRAEFSSWNWQSSVLEVPMQTDLIEESVSECSASARADALSDGLSRWI